MTANQKCDPDGDGSGEGTVSAGGWENVVEELRGAGWQVEWIYGTDEEGQNRWRVDARHAEGKQIMCRDASLDAAIAALHEAIEADATGTA